MKKSKSARSSSRFPSVRLRRLRSTRAIRDLFEETRLSPSDLVAPIFVQEGLRRPDVVKSMPDIRRLPLTHLIDEVEKILTLGIRAVILFGLPATKDKVASSAYQEDGIVQKSVSILRKRFGEKLVIMTDVCLCQYTDHGHCGIVVDKKIDNDSSIETLAKVAVSHARAGADIVAPSAMMDGQVQAIRRALDLAGLKDVAIMGYSAKQASPLYAPFRDAAHSTPEFGDRKSYQMHFANAREAMREVDADIQEGVDIVMIKPAIPYLDLIYRTRNSTDLPICAYSVSGEYALIKAAALNGWADEDAVMTEFLTSIKRAGADIIITYHAERMARLLAKK